MCSFLIYFTFTFEQQRLRLVQQIDMRHFDHAPTKPFRKTENYNHSCLCSLIIFIPWSVSKEGRQSRPKRPSREEWKGIF